MTNLKYVGVFCGGHTGARAEYAGAARAFGAALAEAGLGMVFGGSNKGLMGEVARGALLAGGDVIGVLPRVLLAHETPFEELQQLRLVDDLATRKTLILSLSHACVALPGGFGTLDELFEAATLTQLGLADRPIWLLNTCDYYSRLIGFLDHASQEGLIGERHRALIRVDADPARLAGDIAHHLATR